LGYCYYNWCLLAREQRNRNTEREKLAAALDIFTKLNMPREREAVGAELEKTAAVALLLNRRLWHFTALNSALTQFWCSLGTCGTFVGIDDESVISPKLLP
jgi:hypothetical protein